MGLFKSKLQREYEEWVKFSRGRIPLPDNEYDRFALFMAQRDAYNKSNSGKTHVNTSKPNWDYHSSTSTSYSGSASSGNEVCTVKRYWQKNDLEQNLISKIEKEAVYCFIDNYRLGEFFSLVTNVNVSEEEPLFGSSTFLINIKITSRYHLCSWNSSLGNYSVDKADALEALQMVADEVRAINDQKNLLLRSVTRSANSFVSEKLSGIRFADSRSIKINVDIDFDMGELDEVTRNSEYAIKHY